MSNAKYPVAVDAHTVPIKAGRINYPPGFAERTSSRDKRALGDLFGLTVYGVNMTTIRPGGMSALRHAHTKNDEFIYVVEGEPTLVTDAGETLLKPGMCAGFKAGTGDAHHLVNRTSRDVVYLEIGDRGPGDEVTFPDDDIVAVKKDGKRSFFRKDGTPY